MQVLQEMKEKDWTKITGKYAGRDTRNHILKNPSIEKTTKEAQVFSLTWLPIS